MTIVFKFMENFNYIPNGMKHKLLQLVNKHEDKDKKSFLSEIINSVSEQHHTSPEEVYNDLEKIYEMHLNKKTIDGLFFNRYSEDKDIMILKFFLYKKDNHKLSDIIKILNDFTIQIEDHISYEIKKNDEYIIIHEFEIERIDQSSCGIDSKCLSFFGTFEKLLRKEWIESSFNKLSVLQDLSFDKIKLITVISKYFKHICRKFDNELMENISKSQSGLFYKFIELFELRLNPQLQQNTKYKIEDLIKNKKSEIEDILDQINNVNELKFLKDFYEVLLAIVRTNFYQKKDYISIKIKPSMISFISGIQPYATIYVFSSKFEAVHLRGSKVSRGGLRWSDRRDYPIEVLGLMRAQMKKNTIIIPSGAKGGFYINDREKNKDRNFGVECYKQFLCGILDITDNLDEKNHIIRPDNVVIPCDLEKDIYDDELYDPYVVVAADKGTGTFSDYANEISMKYNFWLGDAFASGGSNGYDHKKLAITSRGAFITVEKLFSELRKNIQETEFAVIGIGDMIGDVFGNGMLLSKKIKLVAAFNHMHIFIDPTPDPITSYAERQRMFNLPTSTWNDYNKDLISKGGGVFTRNAKSIEISKEISKLLDIPSSVSTLSPDELIKYILKAKADLLWNGGIGTFVKAETESHEDASDKANDAIRINGSELRVKVVGEGGNLGFTQLGRIEAAQQGVKINTDFIDNSAGVSCSDREVNIKIALFRALNSKKITLEERNALLHSMQDEVCDLVLKDNVLQNNALMLEESYKFAGFDKHIYLINQLERLNILNRAAEDIPNEQQIEKMRNTKQSLTRPELAVLLTYTKIWLKNEILITDLPDNPYFEKFLIGYFPKQMQETFKDEILNHPLRREIITNYITNTLINRVGINFISNIINKTGNKVYEIIYAYITIRDGYRLRDIWHDIEYCHKFEEIDSKIKSLLEIRKFAEHAVCWHLQQQNTKLDLLKENIANLRENIDYLITNFTNFNNKKNIAECKLRSSILSKQGLKIEFAEKLSKISFLLFAPSLIEISQKTGIDLKQITKLYFLIDDKLELRQVRNNIMNWHIYNMTQESSISILLNNIATEHLKILEYIIERSQFKNNTSEQSVVNNWYHEKEQQIISYQEISGKIYYNSEIDYSHVILLINRMHLLY